MKVLSHFVILLKMKILSPLWNFVKSKYHRQGIGRKLWECVLNHSNYPFYTVHSSPYAVPVYHKLGFIDMDSEQLADGMRFTPMKFERYKNEESPKSEQP